MTVKLTTVILSHLNDAQYEVGSTHPEALERLATRIELLKNLVFHYGTQGKIDEAELDELWFQAWKKVKKIPDLEGFDYDGKPKIKI